MVPNAAHPKSGDPIDEALSSFRAGRLPEALSKCEEALAGQLDDPGEEARALEVKAQVLHRLGRNAEALVVAERAESLVRDLGDPALSARIANTRGNTLQSMARYAEALACFEAALPLWRAAEDPPGEERSLMNVATSRCYLGDMYGCMSLLYQCLELARRRGDRGAEGNALHNIGSLGTTFGEFDRARENVEQALAIFEEIGDRYRQAMALTTLGGVLASLDRATEARPMLERALAVRQEIGDRDGEQFTRANLGRVLTHLGRHDDAKRHYEEALRLARAGSARDTVVKVLLFLSDAETERARFDEAEAYVSEAAAIATASTRPDLLAQLHHSRAILEKGRGRLEDARCALEATLESVERAREGFASPDMRATYLAMARDCYELLVDVTHDLEPEATRLPATFAISERARARALLELLLAEPAELPDPDMRRARRGRPEPLALDAVQRDLLDADSTLLEYAVGDARSHAFVLTRDAARHQTLPGRAEIQELARSALEACAQRDGAADEPLARLAGAILDPLGELPGRRLLVVADDALLQVPFACLPLRGVPLVERHEIVGLPSASVLPALRREALAPIDQVSLALFADPVFAPDEVREPPESSRGVGLSESRFSRLPFSRREAQAIERLFPPGKASVALGLDATREAVLDAAGKHRWLHLATHGFLDGSRPEASGLVFSLVDRDGQPRQGFLSGRDVAGLELHADLVVLSGCRTALGRHLRGEGVIGLSRAFLLAGASRVVASLWRVDDAATSDLMSAFYQGMLGPKRLSAPAALCEAQRWLRSKKRFRAPHFWAPFTLQGIPA